MTIVVSDIAQSGRELDDRGIKLGKVQTGDFGKIAQLTDPDGNMITFAEPPKGAPEKT